ncbi:amino acid permease [bacterium]|nr:MAG: amino acid permease [bacterium]
MLKNLFRTKSVQHILDEAEKGLLEESHGAKLNRTLTVRDLTAFGIAAVVGAGIFSTIGNAAASGGPAVSLLFVFTAIACGFSAMCYAEFASMIPVAGSAYTYAYASFGELIAWIIGWDLLMEYAIGNIAVAISWSDYFTGFLAGIGWVLPEYITMDFLSALRGHDQVVHMLAQGQVISDIPYSLASAYHAWEKAPVLGPLHIVADVPALLITLLISLLIYVGIRESRNASNIMVGIKLGIIFLVITVGFFYINPDNWSPFAPHGVTGVLKGVSAVFFAYIGFDAISTTAEECKNPQRDLPRGMIYSLLICTVLYIIISLTLTGMVNYSELAVGDPMAFVFKQVGLNWLSGVVAISAVIATASVFLVFQIGQARIWMVMSRDGLLPKRFAKVHPKFHTPSFSTAIAGFVVAVPALFMNLTEVTDLTSIGTLFAFVLVCGGSLVLQNSKSAPTPKFKIPYVNSRYIVPALLATGIYLSYQYNGEGWNQFFSMQDPAGKEFGWDVFKHKIPMLLFILVSCGLSVAAYVKKLSLIPILGLTSCLYLMTELGTTNWFRFSIWLAIGLVVYFSFSYRNSKLNKLTQTG